MNKKSQKNIPTEVGTAILFILTIIVIVIYSYYANIQRNSSLYDVPSINIPKIINVKKTGVDPLNAYYLVDKNTIKLENGTYEKSIENSSAKEVIKIFGNPVIGDLNGDGVQADAAIILTQDLGGSGTFYYLVASVKNFYGYKGSNAVFLGDRIEIDKLNIKNGIIELTYLDRAEKDSMADKPSIRKAFSLKVEGSVLVPITK